MSSNFCRQLLIVFIVLLTVHALHAGHAYTVSLITDNAELNMHRDN